MTTEYYSCVGAFVVYYTSGGLVIGFLVYLPAALIGVYRGYEKQAAKPPSKG